MRKVSEIEKLLSDEIPYSLAGTWDNVGLLVGDPDTDVDAIMFAVDITSAVVDEAIAKNCKLIISHHPIIFNALKSVRADKFESAKVYKLIQNGISAICLHTNLDIVPGGMIDVLCDQCGITVDEVIESEGRLTCRIGHTDKPEAVLDFAAKVKSAIKSSGVSFYDCGKKVNKVGVLSGGGSSYLKTAYEQGCDTYFTGELKHNDVIDAAEMGINLVCAGHYYTEKGALALLKSIINKNFSEIRFYDAVSTEELYKFV